MSPLLALLAFQDATFDPTKDPALAKPITIHLALTPLNKVVAALAKETAQPLDVSGNVAEWKATVLVKALPAGRTMEALADTLGLVWKKDGATLRLGRPEGSAAAENAYFQAERAQRGKDLSLNLEGTGMPSSLRPGRRSVRSGRPRIEESPAAPRRTFARFDPTLLAVEGSESPPPSRLEPAAPSGESAFAKAVTAWPSLPKEIDVKWNASIPTPRIEKSLWEEGGRYALSDLLVAWHDASGLPVVADAFRVPTKLRALNPGPGLGVLQGIAGNEGLSMRLSEGVARLRHPAFWRLRTQEIPEFTWSTIERGPATVDAYAAFAARLTPPQVASFRSAEPPLSRVKMSPLREAYPALFLWNALPLAARKTLSNGGPVGLASVRGATNAYLFALREAPFYRAGDPSAVLAMDAGKVGLFGATTPKSFELRLSGEKGGGITYYVVLP